MNRSDIIEIARSTSRYNLHSHTQFCDGRASIAEFASRAAEMGFIHYGFSPHSPLPIDSPCNMAMADVDRYFAEVDKARVSHRADGTHFHRAMEIDFLDDSWGPSAPYFQALGLDYAIGSVHFIPSDEGFIDIDGRFESFRLKMERYFKGDIRHVVETFYAQEQRMLQLGGFDIIGHFDKIGHNADHYSPGIEDEPWYRALVFDMMDLIAEKGVVVEINTKAWADHRRMFPGRRYLQRLRELGVPIVVNSDAHYTDLIDASRPVAYDMLRQAGFNNLPPCP